MTMERGADGPTSTAVAWIGPLPAPVHGASLVTARLLERVRAEVRTSGVPEPTDLTKRRDVCSAEQNWASVGQV